MRRAFARNPERGVYRTADGGEHWQPVLQPGHGVTKAGRLWTYVRDDRAAGSTEAPAVWFQYSPDRKGEWPLTHLKHFTGILQADGYAGFDRLYERGDRHDFAD